jgi:hypothetical protein
MASSSKTKVTQPSYGETSTVKSAVGKDFKANLWAMADKLRVKQHESLFACLISRLGH